MIAYSVTLRTLEIYFPYVAKTYKRLNTQKTMARSYTKIEF